MATPKTDERVAKGKSRRKTAALRTVAEILVKHKEDLLADGIEYFKALAVRRTLELMTEEELRVQTTDLLRTLTMPSTPSTRTSRRRSSRTRWPGCA